MATFGDVLREIQDEEQRRKVPFRDGPSDPIRKKYLSALHERTQRNVIVYYSGWLQRFGPEHFYTTQINDEDKHGFMAASAGMDFTKGLDLVLHTPGGDIAATESIIEYLRSKFNDDINVYVPQISMSGGTMIALSAKRIYMGRHSNLGPIDPQIDGRAAVALLEEFETARREIVANPHQALLWQPILQHYSPTILSRARQSIEWAKEIAEKTLREGMFLGDSDAADKATTIVDFLLSHDVHHAHGRHLHRNELRAKGLVIEDLEDDDDLQNDVLSLHHACMLTVGNHNVIKLIENHNGIAHLKIVPQIQVQMPMQIAQPNPVRKAPQQPDPNQGQAAPPAGNLQPKIPFKTRFILALKLLFGRLNTQ